MFTLNKANTDRLTKLENRTDFPCYQPCDEMTADSLFVRACQLEEFDVILMADGDSWTVHRVNSGNNVAFGRCYANQGQVSVQLISNTMSEEGQQHVGNKYQRVILKNDCIVEVM